MRRSISTAGIFAVRRGVQAQPYGGERSLVISAGNSPVGRSFATRHADCLFTSIREIEELSGKVRNLRAAAGPGAGVYVCGLVITGASAKTARDYYRYIVHETSDWEASEHMVAIRTKGGPSSDPKLAHERSDYQRHRDLPRRRQL